MKIVLHISQRREAVRLPNVSFDTLEPLGYFIYKNQMPRGIYERTYSNTHRNLIAWTENHEPAKIANLDTPCWECTSHKPDTAHGYPNLRRDGKCYSAHRYLYEILFSGFLDRKVVVRHKCDNRLCINPEHLESGTQADNVADTTKRGRVCRGERQHLTHLTNDNVLEIRSSAEMGVHLAARFNVHANTISCIKRRLTWKHI